jgi:hypothetical protein
LKVFKWLLIGVSALAIIIGLGIGIAWLATAPKSLPKGGESASRLERGRYSVGHAELEWVDRSRRTPKNGDYPGAAERKFRVALWFPRNTKGEHPHFLSIRFLLN